MGLLLKHWRRVSLAALAVFTAWSLATDTGARTCAVVLDAREAEKLCGSFYPVADFWERFKTMGGAGVVLEPETVADRLRAGDALGYSKEEIEKMKATKVAAKDAPLTPESLWIRRPGFSERLKAAAQAHGFKLELRKFEDQDVAVLPAGRDPASISAGFDPQKLASLKKAGLLPVLRVDSLPELLLSGGAGTASLIHGDPGPIPEGKLEALLAGEHWGAFSSSLGRAARARLYRDAGKRREKLSVLGEAGLAGGEAAFLRQASKNSMVRVRLDAGGGVEGNLAVLRAGLKALRKAGYAPALGAAPPAGRAGPHAAWPPRFVLGFLLVLAGPILAMRASVSVLRGMRENGRLPEASPVREALAGSGAALLVSCVCAAATYAVFSTAAWRLGATRLDLGLLAPGAVFLLGWLALYDADPGAVKALFKRSMGRSSAARTAVPVVLATVFCLSPRPLEEFGPGAWLDVLSGVYPDLWWAGERWREWLVGYPCLFTGLCVLFDRLEGEAEADPRGWLLLGLFAPVGLALASASARLPFFVLLKQTAAGASAGLFLGLLFLGARHLFLKRLLPKA